VRLPLSAPGWMLGGWVSEESYCYLGVVGGVSGMSGGI